MAKKRNSKKHKNKVKIAVPNITSDRALPGFTELSENIPYQRRVPIFSFRYMDCDHRKYSHKSYSQCNQLHQLLEKLCHYCKMTWGEIESGDYHAHGFEWSRSSMKSGFSSKLNIPDTAPPYQFQAVGKGGRVVGFHAHKVFFIVWFDPNHRIFPNC